MTKHQKKAIIDYWADYAVPFQISPVSFSEIYKNNNPVIFEIGFGMGETTVNLSERYPNYNFLGVEVYKPGIGKLLSELKAKNIQNVRFIYNDAVDTVKNMIPDKSLTGVHIFFPDPWPKKKHHKRRLLQKVFLDILLPKITRLGYIYVVTDWEDYAWDIIEVLDGYNDFNNPYEYFSPPVTWRPCSKFEQKGKKKGHIIREIWFQRFI